MRLARVLSASASGGAASWSSCSPDSESRQTSSFLRLRSNPACNIEVGPPLSSLLGDSRSVSPEGALLHGSPSRACREARPGPSLAGESSSFAKHLPYPWRDTSTGRRRRETPHVPRPVTISLRPPEQRSLGHRLHARTSGSAHWVPGDAWRGREPTTASWEPATSRRVP